jgi:hypothetical protein
MNSSMLSDFLAALRLSVLSVWTLRVGDAPY